MKDTRPSSSNPEKNCLESYFDCPQGYVGSMKSRECILKDTCTHSLTMNNTSNNEPKLCSQTWTVEDPNAAGASQMSIQDALDGAYPGDLITTEAVTYDEHVVFRQGNHLRAADGL